MATKILSFTGGATGIVADPSYAIGYNGTWTYDGTYNGVSKIVGILGDAIDTYLQGVVFNSTYAELYQYPAWFGAITPDNSATAGPEIVQAQYAVSTYVPNSNAPYITHLTDAAFQGVWSINKVEDNNTIWLDDPLGIASLIAGASFVGASTNVGTMKRVHISNTSKYGIMLPGKSNVLNIEAPITLEPNQYGIVEPFVIIQNDGDLTITITQ
jgi:hypothetical protein